MSKGRSVATNKGTPRGALFETMDATPGFEPGVKALQASALPLGHVADEKGRSFNRPSACDGADNGARTRDPNLGKVVLYQLSHVRLRESTIREIPGARKGLFGTAPRGPDSKGRPDRRP